MICLATIITKLATFDISEKLGIARTEEHACKMHCDAVFLKGKSESSAAKLSIVAQHSFLHYPEPFPIR